MLKYLERLDIGDVENPNLSMPARNEIPVPGLEHEAEWLNLPLGASLPAVIGHCHHTPVEHRTRNARQEGCRARGPIPVSAVEVEPPGDAVGLLAARLGQGSQQLVARPRCCIAQTHRLRLARQTDQQHRFGLGSVQPGKLGPVTVEQLEAAAGPAITIDRNARCAERIDIAIDGADRNLELFRKFVRGQPLPQLQQDQDRQEAAGAHLFCLAENN